MSMIKMHGIIDIRYYNDIRYAIYSRITLYEQQHRKQKVIIHTSHFIP